MRDLIDPEDGENRAVRSFLLLYGGASGITVGTMKKHMSTSGWEGMWPEWANTHQREHLTKGGAQHWLRHLFALEATPLPTHPPTGEAECRKLRLTR